MGLDNQFPSGIRSLPVGVLIVQPSVFHTNAQATGDGFCWCGHLYELRLSVWRLPLNILLVINRPVALQWSAMVTTWRKKCLKAFNLFNSLGARFNAEWVQISMRFWSWTRCIPSFHESSNWTCPLIEWRKSQTVVIQDDSMWMKKLPDSRYPGWFYVLYKYFEIVRWRMEGKSNRLIVHSLSLFESCVQYHPGDEDDWGAFETD